VPLLVVFLIAALIFGIGGVIKGLFWLTLIGLVLLAVAVWWAWRTVTGSRTRSST
jgi:membrane protein implicated in regulation of membrane protease activity